MQPLEKNLRNQLERTVISAREIAEAGARAALEQLGVGDSSDPMHLSQNEKILRRKLRIHGFQLGDARDSKSTNPSVGKQDISLLAEEVAYEHWHRMLFARFLAENNLLMYWSADDDEPIDIPLETCQELIDEGTEKAGSKWELASRFAARMLPQIFRLGSPVFQLSLPPEHQQGLEGLIADLPHDVFTASDALGWVYQFWQAKKKDEVNASQAKIGARELPAVTQLFTEPYIVSFLLDNSLGAWWAGRRIGHNDFKNAQSEEELRVKAAVPGVPLEYLRFVQREDGGWLPVAGTFDGWPAQLKDLKTLDPCCGSGHFLVATLLMLVPMRMELETLTAREAVDAVLRENIHGLEIDKRCVELAAFALALTAWRYPDAGGYRILPELNVACSGLAISANKEKWLALAGNNSNLCRALELLYQQFKDAPVLGSLINPEASLDKELLLFKIPREKVESLLAIAMTGEKDDENAEMGVVAQGLAKAASLLMGSYTLVTTNVPYLVRSKQVDILRSFSEKSSPEGKNDIATTFLERCLDFGCSNSTVSIILPQNWLFATTYQKFREKLLRQKQWNLVARLGEGGFDSPAAAGAFTVMIVLTNEKNTTSYFGAIDAKDARKPDEKALIISSGKINMLAQANQLRNPDSRVVLEALEKSKLLSDFANSFEGLSTGDLNRFSKKFWEFEVRTNAWVFFQGSVDSSSHYGGRDQLLLWENGKGELAKFPGSYIKGMGAWNKRGIRVTQLRSLACTLYTGEIFDKNAATILSKKEEHIIPIYEFCTSKQFHQEIRKIDQRMNVMIGTMIKAPFDVDYWTKIVEEKYPNGLPKPYSNDPTQWIFHGHPCGSVTWDEHEKWITFGKLRTDENVLQVALGRLLGYRWPAELNANMELSDEQHKLVKDCESLLPFTDDDGILCILPVRGEEGASDCLLNLLAASYGEKWTNDTMSDLLDACDHAGKTLDTWLRDKFFLQHCKLFHHRPFIWHVWDGLRDGFSALVNYHKLDNKLLERLIYTYLGDWIGRQRQDITDGVDGAHEKLAAAEVLKKKLELILEGESPYDIFVRWKPIEKQPIGWNPDLNDGVRLNIRPFMTAGVLRFNKKPQINISWDKDRGKDIESAPWHHLFKGDRINDHHLSLADKHTARRKNND